MTRREAILSLTVSLTTMLVTGACTETGPRPLVPGVDTCARCRMTIDDLRFGALVLNAHGRLSTFDSIECVAAFVRALPASDAPRAVWVADFEDPSRWLDATQARYLRDSSIRSPMGRSLIAVSPDTDMTRLVAAYGGTPIGWSELLTLVAVDAHPL